MFSLSPANFTVSKVGCLSNCPSINHLQSSSSPTLGPREIPFLGAVSDQPGTTVMTFLSLFESLTLTCTPLPWQVCTARLCVSYLFGFSVCLLCWLFPLLCLECCPAPFPVFPSRLSLLSWLQLLFSYGMNPRIPASTFLPIPILLAAH